MESYKIYNLKIPGIDRKLFNNPFYLNQCRKISFNGIIHEEEIPTENGTDYITLAPKFKPHSDYEMMLQTTDSILKSPITSLSDEAVKYIFTMAYEFIDFLSDEKNINYFNMNGGYPYLAFNYDEFTTDRHSGMSKKPFHLHLNSWKKDTIDRIEEIDIEKVSPFYYESVVDPVFELTQILAYDALDCDEINKYITPVKLSNGNQEIGYSATYKINGGWKFISSDELPKLLKKLHDQLEKRYKEILKCFCGTDELPDLYTRHLLLPESVIARNILASDFQDTTKDALIRLIGKVRSIDSKKFSELSTNTNLRDTIIPTRWLAYSIGIFSNEYIDANTPIIEKDVYINCTPRLYTKIGGASIMNFPDYSLTKIDRGEGYVSQEEFDKKVEFQKALVKKVKGDNIWK